VQVCSQTQSFLYVLLKISGDGFGTWFYAWHVFLLPCVYHTIRYVQTEISLVLMLTRKQTNVSPTLPPNWKWCGIFHIFWFKVHHHVSACRWKGLSTQCLMPYVTTLPARYLVQHHCTLFCDNVFSRMHLVTVNASTRSNTKLSPRSTHPRHISEHSFWDMTRCIKCIQPRFNRKGTLMLSLNQIRYPYAFIKPNQV